MTRRIRGDGELFYLHIMRWYFPKMLRKVYNSHNLGIYVFTMEGFEYKNQTSKRMVKTRTNGEGNIPKQSMQAMHMLFSGMHHNVKKSYKSMSVISNIENVSREYIGLGLKCKVD